MKRAFVVFVALTSLVSIGFGQKPAVVVSNEAGWHKIGEITADFESENESIAIFGADKFQAIKLKVTDAPINIEKMQIHYEGDAIQDVDVHSEMKIGSETRVIKLDHPTVELEKVTFTYKTLPNSQEDKAEVEVYGLKTAAQSNSYSDDDKDADDEIEREARGTSAEIEREAEETENDIDRETDEAKAEVKEEAREAEREIEKETRDAENTADNVGDDISEAAANVGAEIKDKPYVDKVGPDGQKIYMDKHSKYYYINEQGKKVYITKLQMKDNPKRD